MIIESLKSINAPYQKLIERSLLNKFELQNPNRFLPIHTMYDFLGVTGKYFESKDTNQSFFQNIKLCNLGNTGKLMYSSTQLLPALQYLVKYYKYFCTNQSTEFQINGSTSIIKNKFIDINSKGGNVMEFIWLSMLKNLFTSVNNNAWKPIEVHFMSDRSLFSKQFVNKDVSIKFNQEHSAIVFNSSLLTKKIISNEGCFDNSITNRNLSQRPPIGLADKIEHFFENNSSEYLPTLPVMAEFYGVSPATLKRHLILDNSNYKSITAKWRLNTSVSLITNTNLSMIEVSNKLHYSNPANFVRAFKSWTGHTPLEFKKLK